MQNDNKGISQKDYIPCLEGEIYNTETGKFCPEEDEPIIATSTPLSETGV